MINKRAPVWCLSFLLLLSLVGGCVRQQASRGDEGPTIARIKERGTLRVGANVTAPWLMQDPKSRQWIGAGAVWAEAMAKELGVKLEYVESDWGLFVAGLQSDKFDITNAALWETPERAKVIDFVTWSKSGICYLVLKTNSKVNTVADLNNPSVTIGVTTGSAGESIVRKAYPNAKVDSIAAAPGQVERLNDLLARRIDVTFVDSALGPIYEKRFPQIKVIPESGQYCATNPDHPNNIGAGIRKGDDKWKAFVTDFIGKKQEEINASLIKFSTEEYMTPAK